MNPVALTRSVNRTLTKVTCGGAPVYVWPGGGIIRPTLLVDGLVIGTWTTRRAKGRNQISIDAFAPLEADVRAALEDEVQDIGRFEGLTATLAVA